jgi:ubiquinone/menaquinone biosynthesis C-methylase UbiE
MLGVLGMAETISTSFIRPETFWRDLGLAAGQRVVHLGCGPGFYVLPAAHIVGKTGKVIGVDVLAPLLAAVESRAQRENVTEIIETIRANLEMDKGSTLPGGSADWVLVANILHQSDPVKILTEAARVVAPTGSIVVVEWDVVATPLGPPPERRIPESAVRQHIQALGLRVERAFKPSPYHYGLVLKKAV